MQILFYILSFLAGSALVFYWQRVRLSKWGQTLQIKITELVTGQSVDQNLFSSDTYLPDELNEVIKVTSLAIDQIKSSDGNSNLDSKELDTTKKLKKSVDNLYIVNELGRKVTSSLNLQQTFRHLYNTINSMMDAAVLELNSYDPETKRWKLFSNIEHGSGSNSAEPSYHNHFAEWSINNNREVFLTDAERDFGRYVFKPLVMPDDRTVKSIMVFPIAENGQVTATLAVMSFQKNMYGEYHQEIIRLLLGYVAVAMNNSFTLDELNRTKVRAEQGEKFKEQFLANMSHEIRTPIHAVTGMTRLLLEKSPRADQMRYLESIRNASDSLLVIINDILDLSKIEAGKIEFEKIDFSVNEVLNNIREIMHFKAEEKGLILTLQETNNIPPVLIGDPTRLSQILMNLVGNAIKFTEKGEISIIVNVKSIDRNNATLEFRVKDTGIGMTPEQQSKIFSEYTQASTETSRKYGGTGLGLSISQQLVNLQNGTISIESAPGRGSTFSFTLNYPVSQNAHLAQSEQTISPEMISKLKGIRVLIADDNEYNRMVAKETIEMELSDVVVEEANDGELALDLIRANNYDIVLMDLVMPHMDGLTATHHIRHEFPAPINQLKIVALTASVIKSEIDKCYEAGMNGFIPKPFTPFELVNGIYKAVNPDKNPQSVTPTIHQPDDIGETGLINLQALIRITGNDTFRYNRFIDMFITKTPEELSAIRNGLLTSNLDQIRIAAHNLKPSLSSVGCARGYELAEQIETSCQENKNGDKLHYYFDELFDICNKVIAIIKTTPKKNITS